MKLLIITVIKEFENDIRRFLFEAGIKEFTCINATGCRDASAESMGNNWFATEIYETDSILAFAFAKEENIVTVENAVIQFNASQQSQSKIHLFTSSTGKLI